MPSANKSTSCLGFILTGYEFCHKRHTTTVLLDMNSVISDILLHCIRYGVGNNCAVPLPLPLLLGARSDVAACFVKFTDAANARAAVDALHDKARHEGSL